MNPFVKEHIRTLLSALVGLLVVGSSAYGIYTLQKISKENEILRTHLNEVKSENAEVESPEGAPIEKVENESYEDEIEIKSKSEKVSIEDRGAESTQVTQGVVVKEAVVNTESSPVLESAPAVSEEVVEDSEDEEMIEVAYVGQTIYDDEYGGTYGAFGLTLTVRPRGGDILIPMTTNDTKGTGIYGFSYTVVGIGDDSFSGKRSSDISLCTLRDGGYCKFKDGQTKSIKLTTWANLTNKESDGDYAVQFNRVTYFFNGERKVLELNKKTEYINLHY